jgi:CheY-like chemotaxis protein
MVEPKEYSTILIVDDDEDDFFLVKSAFEEIDFPFGYQLGYLPNGQDLMEYLQHSGRYVDPKSSPRPRLILLDLNMPRKDGREALREIKADPDLEGIPVVILTTSSQEEDKSLARNLGALSFITKPSSFDELVAILKRHSPQWFR